MSEAKGTTVNKEGVGEYEPREHEYSVPQRVLRWLVIHFFKVIEGIIRLFGLIYYGLKTMVMLVFRFFWPYPVYFRRHK